LVWAQSEVKEMTDALLLIIGVIALANLVFLIKLASGRDVLAQNQLKTDSIVREELARSRDEAVKSAREAREELSGSFKSFGDSVSRRMSEVAGLQKNQLETFTLALNRLTDSNEQKLDKMRETMEQRTEKLREAVEESLKSLQEDNSQKLEQMRATVDEKLHATLEKRLGESFKLVSERLELVHKGLGEMQTLATGVGDLKKVLTNVRARGTLGEIQLENILEQVLSPEQYAKNVATRKGSSERVEFAIRLPGRDKDSDCVWLPLDSKFPLEDYQRLSDAFEQANPAAAEEAAKQLEVSIKLSAKAIRDKYLDPPNTTDFGIMFLPVEGLYAEVLRRTGLFESLQRDFRVIVTGPTTLAALLSSLQMGFKTLAIEKRSSEVWELLGAIKTEFGKFGSILSKTHKKLQEVSNTIEDASRKSRTIERKLRSVQELPAPDAVNLLGVGDFEAEDDAV
jgi:DNA recombination protein RmuC